MDASIGELLSLDGKTALVTGGATGIGEGIARLLAAAGALVVIGDIDAEGAASVAGSIARAGHQAAVIALDVTDPERAAAAVDEAAGLGDGLDIVVNNAGSYRDAASILDMPHESWRRLLAVNLDSVFNCTQPAARRMVHQGRGGAVVNIASVDGFLPCLGPGYDTAKAGVIHLTRTLALDLAPHRIRVNAVAPGHIMVDTLRRMRSGELPPVWQGSTEATGLMGPIMQQRAANIPLGHSGEPADIARAVLFLCSQASRYVIGQTLVVDGGWTLV